MITKNRDVVVGMDFAELDEDLSNIFESTVVVSLLSRV